MNPDAIWEGVAIGAAGGASAGLILAILKGGSDIYRNVVQTRRIIRWLQTVTQPEGAEPWRNTYAIASYTNVTEARVRYLCSHSKRIVRSAGANESWGLLGVARDESATGIYFPKPDQAAPKGDRTRS